MRSILKLSVLLFIFFNSCTINATANHKDECVILLHGLGDIKLSMSKLDHELQKAGYSTINLSYPSNDKKIEEISKDELSIAVLECKNYKKIHFITHSMGGIIVRYYLQDHKLPKGSRIVMLSPPNEGSAISDYFEDSKLYKLFYGEVGQELQTDSKLLKNLDELDYEIGIIGGNKSINPFFSAILPGKDDGKVSVDNMKLAEMKDFIVIPTTHLFIKYNKDAAKQAIIFLQTGKFDYIK